MFITNSLHEYLVVGKDRPPFHASHHVIAITFLLVGVITFSILFVFTLVLNQNHTAMAQPPPNGNFFQIDNVTFSHNSATVNMFHCTMLWEGKVIL